MKRITEKSKDEETIEKKKKKMNTMRAEKSERIYFERNYIESGEVDEETNNEVTVIEEGRQEEDRFERGVVMAAIERVKVELNIPYRLHKQQVTSVLVLYYVLYCTVLYFTTGYFFLLVSPYFSKLELVPLNFF